MSADITHISFLRSLRDRWLIGFVLTVIGTSLGAAAVFRHVPETAVYVGAFGFAFVFTLGSRFLFAKKATVAGREAQARSTNSIEAKTPSIIELLEHAYQISLVVAWAGATVIVDRISRTTFFLDGFSNITFRALEIVVDVAVLVALLNLIWFYPVKTKNKRE